jgi:uncharacterized membrane protein
VTTAHLALRSVHIVMGLTALISGAAAMTFRKGSRLHRQAGNVFFVAMLIMAASGAWIAAIITPNGGNVMGGALAFYLTLTAWATVWRPPRETGWLEIGAALLGLATASVGLVFGLRAVQSPRGLFYGYPPALYFIFASVALLGTALDVRMIVRGGLAGAARLTRHLWRMCIALFIATSSFFLGQAKLFPGTVRRSGVLTVPVLLVVGAFVYWLIRIRLLPWIRRTGTPGAPPPLPDA